MSNKELTIKMNKELSNLHKDITPEILPIDDQIRASIGNHKNYKNADLLKLNLNVFLNYSEQLIGQVKEYLKSLRWVKTHDFWTELRNYEKIDNEIKNNVVVNVMQIEAAKNLLYNLGQLMSDLRDSKQDFDMETRKIYLRYLGVALGGFTTIYAGFYNTFATIFGVQAIGVYVFVMFVLSVFISSYFYPDILKS